jgi:diaminopropionate ammonia-lyase
MLRLENGQYRIAVSRSAAGEMPPEVAKLISQDDVRRAYADIVSWPGYAPTPFYDLPGLARKYELAAVKCKWEGSRFGIGSFKPLGPSFALVQHLRRRLAAQGIVAEGKDLLSGAYYTHLKDLSACAATSGNHGRAVAWAAQQCGLSCRIFMPDGTSQHRREAIAAFGAEIVIVKGSYDDAAAAAAQAARNGSILIAGYAGIGDPAIARDMVIGYSALAGEAIIQSEQPPTHIFVAGGSGRLGAAILAAYWHRYGSTRPRLIMVEPIESACLLESADAGEIVAATGSGRTLMDGLAVVRPAALAWAFLGVGAYAFIAIDDDVAALEVAEAAAGCDGDPPIAIGETGIAAWAGLALTAQRPELRNRLELDEESVPLVVACEGVTDPEIHRRLVEGARRVPAHA